MKRFGLEEKDIENIVGVFKQFTEIEKAVIFGSRARGDFRDNSDIDIALYGEKITNDIHTQIFYKLEELYLIYKIDLINFYKLGQNNSIKNNIINEGVEIYAK